jgi:hypothetical protein
VYLRFVTLLGIDLPAHASWFLEKGSLAATNSIRYFGMKALAVVLGSIAQL